MKNKSFPNVALMKISKYYKDKGYIVEWFNSFNALMYEKVFLSKIFTYTDYCNLYDYANKDTLILGGTGVDEKIKLPSEIENSECDYSIYDIDYSVGFMTRGCNNNCNWCIVPRKEGKVVFSMPIDKIAKNTSNKVVLLDNNFLQYEDCKAELKNIIDSNYKIDFNQGLDVRLVDDEVAYLLSKVKWIKYIRFSCDSISQLSSFEKAIKLLKKNGLAESRIFIYLLVKDIDSAEFRVNYFRNNFNKVTIYAQPYRDFEGEVEITKEQKEFSQRYVYSGSWRKKTWTAYNFDKSCGEY